MADMIPCPKCGCPVSWARSFCDSCGNFILAAPDAVTVELLEELHEDDFPTTRSDRTPSEFSTSMIVSQGALRDPGL